jgi:flagellin-like protein
MKGISEVIAIILILMIVIALAALAYTWFSGIFASLTGTASTSITQTTQQMQAQFILENAKNNSATPFVTLTIRNTGATDIKRESLTTYVNDRLFTNDAATGTLSTGSTYTFNITDATLTQAIACTICSNHRCYTSSALTTSSTLTVTIGTGLQQSKQISC